MADTSLLTCLFALLLLTLAPGADTLLVIRNTLRGGWREGDVTSLGVCCGLFVHAGLSACGISLILLRSANAFFLLKTLGALYLIWLGLKSLCTALKKENISPPIRSEKKQSVAFAPPLKAFQEGFLSNVLNPKTGVFYMAFLPQFIRSEDPVLSQSLFLAGLHFIMALSWLCLVAHGLHHLRRFFQNPACTRWMEGVSGGLLVGLGLRLGLGKILH